MMIELENALVPLKSNRNSAISSLLTVICGKWLCKHLILAICIFFISLSAAKVAEANNGMAINEKLNIQNEIRRFLKDYFNPYLDNKNRILYLSDLRNISWTKWNITRVKLLGIQCPIFFNYTKEKEAEVYCDLRARSLDNDGFNNNKAIQLKIMLRLLKKNSNWTFDKEILKCLTPDSNIETERLSYFLDSYYSINLATNGRFGNYLDWIDIKKISWFNVSSNESIIDLIEYKILGYCFEKEYARATVYEYVFDEGKRVIIHEDFFFKGKQHIGYKEKKFYTWKLYMDNLPWYQSYTKTHTVFEK